jgi:putative protease
MRRAACEKLDERQKVRPVLQTRSVEEIQSWLSKRRVGTVAGGTAGLNVLIRDSDQLEALEGLPLATVYLDYEFGRDYGPSLERVRAMGFQAGIATTRILKPGETGHLGYIKRLAPDSVLVRNLGAWQFLHTSGIPLVGDFSLNVANSLTAEWLMEKGFARLVPSYDLNRDQLFDLLDRFTPSAFEITVHQYMPSFHMEHCVFAAFLSNGTSYRDCGRPCERHTVELRDRTGACHPLKADAECRNTMFTGTAQSAAKLVPELLKRGVTSFRLEALSESSDELRTKVSAYLSLLSGDAAAQRVISQLGLVEKYGVTEGQLLNLRIYEDRKKEDRV